MINLQTIVIKFAQENKTSFPLYIDIDPSEHRSGVDPAAPSSLTLAQKIHNSEFVTLHGLYVHGGNSYESTSATQIEKFAELERSIILEFDKKLKDIGINVPIIATGSTPTSTHHPKDVTGINEFHPGNYTVLDTFQASIGTCSFQDCALTILCRVISQYNFPVNRLLTDAGAFALSKDLGPTHINNYRQYGIVVDHPDLKIKKVSQEVGLIVHSDGKPMDLAAYPVGSLLSIIPNHSCMTTYCYEYLNVFKDGFVIDQWKTCPRHNNEAYSLQKL